MISRSTPDKLTDSKIYQSDCDCGLIWIETMDRDRLGAGADELGAPYQCWMLVDPDDDRVMAIIEGPEPGKICYSVGSDGKTPRRFVSEEGAKNYAMDLAHDILQEEWQALIEKTRPKRKTTKKVTTK